MDDGDELRLVVLPSAASTTGLDDLPTALDAPDERLPLGDPAMRVPKTPFTPTTNSSPGSSRFTRHAHAGAARPEMGS
jgi:hypothetical protein